jgi:hypothetical protein
LGIDVGIDQAFPGRNSSSNPFEEIYPFLHEIPKKN